MSNRSSFAVRVRSRQPLVGIWMQIPHPTIAETLAQTGVDFLLVDGEHAPIPPNLLGSLLPAADLYDMPTIYRVAWNRIELIKAALDAGATGLMIPMVNSPQEAAAVVAGAKYPPMGARGLGAWRASNYYQEDAEYRQHADSSTVVVVQIETRQAVEAVDEIAAVPGIDVLYIGPGDLALSLGLKPGELNSQLIAACKKVAAAAQRNSLAAGIDVASPDYIRPYADLGFSLLTYGMDFQFILDGGRAVAKEVRAKLS